MPGWEGELPPPSIRTVDDMRSVLADPACKESGSLYFMYRDLARNAKDRCWLSDHHLRYDLTVIPPRELCGEYVKTKGHYHPRNPAGVGYPEIYEVLDGEAWYLLQSKKLDDIVLVAAKAGDLVIIPPEYGHVSINPSPARTLVMANIVSTRFESEYGEYETRHGAAYYAMGGEKLKKNPHYPAVPAVRKMGMGFSIERYRFCASPLYDLIGNGEALAFLNHPEQYREVFKGLLKD